jgi:hypothetical protein
MGKQEDIQLLVVKGAISDMPKEQREKIMECFEKIKTLTESYQGEGYIALALFGAEIAAKGVE